MLDHILFGFLNFHLFPKFLKGAGNKNRFPEDEKITLHMIGNVVIAGYAPEITSVSLHLGKDLFQRQERPVNTVIAENQFIKVIERFRLESKLPSGKIVSFVFPDEYGVANRLQRGNGFRGERRRGDKDQSVRNFPYLLEIE